MGAEYGAGASSIDIGMQSCVGTDSCNGMGGIPYDEDLSSGIIDIGEGACVGADSCYQFGNGLKNSSYPLNMKVWDYACVGNSTCYECMAGTSALSVAIPSGEDCAGKVVVN